MNFTPVDEQNRLISDYILSQPNFITPSNPDKIPSPTETRVREFEPNSIQLSLLDPIDVITINKYGLHTTIDKNRDTEERTPVSLYRTPELNSIDRSGINTRQYLQK